MAKKTRKTPTRPAAAKSAVKKSAKPAPAKKAVAPAKKPTASGAPALPPKYDQPLETYSAYAQHRILLEKFGTDEAGQAKVFKHGTETLGLPEGQVRTYIKEKLNAILRDEQKKTGLHPSKPQVENVSFAFEPNFKYPNRETAKRALLGIARRSGTMERAYHVVGEKGKFAVVPAHIMPDGKPPQFKKGDIVMDTVVADSRAIIKEAGPWQSIIEFLSERKYQQKEQCVPNFYLVKLDPAELKAFHAEQAEADKKAAKLAKQTRKTDRRQNPNAREIRLGTKSSKSAPAKKAPTKKAR